MEIYNTTSEEDLHPNVNLYVMKYVGPNIRKYIRQKSRLKYTLGMKSTKFILQEILSIKCLGFFNK